MLKRLILPVILAFCVTAVYAVDLTGLKVTPPFRMLEGIGTDWKALQMGQPLDFETGGSISIPARLSRRSQSDKEYVQDPRTQEQSHRGGR